MKLIKAYESLLDREVYKLLLNHIFFFKSGKEMIVFTKDTKQIKSISSEKNLKIWIDQNFPNLFNFPNDMAPEEIAKIKKNIYDIMIVDLQIQNQYAILSYSRDPWSTEAKIIRDDHKLEYIAPHFYIKPYQDKFLIDEVQMNLLVDDYRQHFPQFDDFLNWVIANRFTSNRRTSYSYLRVNAGFGKSFLASIFEELGTGRKILQTQLKHNSASDLSPVDFRNSFILLIDEFTHFAQELKDLTHGMYLSAKYQMSEYVPLYAKVFLSAEKSTSFFGDAGVDEQLADRVSIIDLSNCGKLENRKLYKANTKLYHEAIKKYVHIFFRKKSKEYIKMGELKANKEANGVLDGHFKKYHIESDTIERIREKCVGYLYEYVEWCATGDMQGMRSRNTFFEKLERVCLIKNPDEVVVKDLVKMYEILISESGDQFAKTARFKQTMLDEIFEVNLIKKQHKCNGKNVRGVLINLAMLDDTPKVLLQIEDKNGKIETIDEVPY